MPVVVELNSYVQTITYLYHFFFSFRNFFLTHSSEHNKLLLVLVICLCCRRSNLLLKIVLFERGVHKVSVGKPEGKRPLGRPRRRWEDNIKMDLLEVGRGCGDWMELAQDRERWRALVSTVMNFRVP